jgi:hypothetical protein
MPARPNDVPVFAPRRRRKGVYTLELIMVVPIILIATIAAFQFGLALVVKQSVVHAATVAAREAGKGADADELEVVVEEVLAAHGITIGSEASLVLETFGSSEMRGTLACDPPMSPSLGVDDVRVTVCVDLGGSAFFNPLVAYGIDFTGKTFTASSLVKKEF